MPPPPYLKCSSQHRGRCAVRSRPFSFTLQQTLTAVPEVQCTTSKAMRSRRGVRYDCWPPGVPGQGPGQPRAFVPHSPLLPPLPVYVRACMRACVR
eukprot:scaffold307298_cov23-Tisochrysis_lutea.AAC.1